MAPYPPAVDAGHEKSDPRVALPPALVRALELVDNGDEARGPRRIGHVPDLVRGVAIVAKQVDLALVAPRKVGPVAHPRHLRAAGFSLAGLAWNMREGARLPRIGDVEDR